MSEQASPTGQTCGGVRVLEPDDGAYESWLCEAPFYRGLNEVQEPGGRREQKRVAVWQLRLDRILWSRGSIHTYIYIRYAVKYTVHYTNTNYKHFLVGECDRHGFSGQEKVIS